MIKSYVGTCLWVDMSLKFVLLKFVKRTKHSLALFLVVTCMNYFYFLRVVKRPIMLELVGECLKPSMIIDLYENVSDAVIAK